MIDEADKEEHEEENESEPEEEPESDKFEYITNILKETWKHVKDGLKKVAKDTGQKWQ